jgi:hypothetical protein
MEESLRQNPTQELMTPERERILAMGIVELSQKLKSGDLDPVAVMEAYQVFKINKVEIQKRFPNPYHCCHKKNFL